jgi:uncharacterized membrane-anchored protein YitT (DUF2179 family)
MTAVTTPPPPSTSAHGVHEDLAAGLTGTLLVALGITLFSKATILTGGTAGLSLLVQYASGWPFWLVFFLVNLPFYALSVLRMGWKLTLRTIIAVALVSFFARMTPAWVHIEAIAPLYAALAGGALSGVGLLILFRHRTSLGGVNIVALYAQERHGLRAGAVMLAIDSVILLCSLFVIDWQRFGYSLLGIAAVNIVIATNHRPGRYLGMS